MMRRLLYSTAIGLVVGILVAACVCIVMLNEPTIIQKLQQKIDRDLPPGTPLAEVEKWLVANELPNRKFTDKNGQLRIELLLLNTGTWSEKYIAAWPKDAHVRFFFDEQMRLIRYEIDERDRF